MDLFLLNICYNGFLINGFYLKLRVSNRGLEKKLKACLSIICKKVLQVPYPVVYFSTSRFWCNELTLQSKIQAKRSFEVSIDTSC